MEPAAEPKGPKVFISYSWTSKGHQARIIEYAKRLTGDGVDIVLDKFGLKEGDDKYAFMERMVTDATVTHVLVFSDKAYAEKADARKAGVGTESQIISKEVYDKVSQSKFIPIACELSEKGEPYMPVFFKSRIWFDFSSAEAINENWEGLIRLLYNKPLLEKPQLGKPPAYITEDRATPNEAFAGKLSVLRQALIHGQRGLSGYRRDFADSVIEFIEALRVRAPIEDSKVAESLVETFRKLVPARDAIVDWVLAEANAKADGFEDALLLLLERLLAVKGPTREFGSYQERWFDAHAVFVYQVFLYVVAALLRTECYQTIHTVLFGHYLFPADQPRNGREFGAFDEFYGYTESINSALTTEQKRYNSQAAELIKRHAQRTDITFNSLVEADGLCLLAGIIQTDTRWFPQTFYYLGYQAMPFFVRAAQKRHFTKLATIMGAGSLAELKQKVEAGAKRTEVEKWFPRFNNSLIGAVNYEKWDTLS